ncbi:DUF885 domain-containing protein [Sandarakinorhabdus cyanobacteriorum]|uniref:DUF885 domain-containing protein n=1 Tax=Sandarakinorhabdus cyanobacteriorum TaxID=1981098 RepID=A0A255YLH3_9SPHN|nr:DUF885 domain-containing protein [Sandarakinorhabdus cyanobacteriorum]OYQ30029.1 DUF885 domain-containing protein [Sandarakinorhabdus cyanobacteriorum]
MRASALLIAVSLFAVTPALAQTAAPAPAQAAESPSARLAALFAKSDADNLKRNPLYRLFRGDTSAADQMGELITDAAYAAEKRAAENELKALAAIDRAALTPDEQVSYDTFKWQRETDLAGLSPALIAATAPRPIDHFFGFHNFVAELQSGESAAPFKTVKDYEDALKRHEQFVLLLDLAILRFRQGMQTGVVQPKLVVNNIIDQLNNLTAGGTEGSIMMKPVQKFPDGISAADQARLKAAYAWMVGERVNPALIRMRDFLKTEYLPVAREAPGLGAMPGGPELYRYLVASSTTTALTPDEIHNIGLSEVARILKGMDEVKARVGFQGDRKAFFEFLRTDKQFKFATAEAMGDAFRATGKRVDAVVGNLFDTIPKSPLEIKPVPPHREKTDAAGSYNGGTPDGSRPGIFYYNAYDLPSRSNYGVETLYLHEAVPGHHFQISLAQENDKLPAFQRFGGNTAFAEGWGLYAESLGPELGMFKDPYQLQGRYEDEMLRAMRLVVDTGIHSKGWGRDQAIDYMLVNSSMSRTDAVAEVERYIAIPSQALAYKIGQLTISRLRAKAEAALGPKFNIKGFHAQVLMTGALPMAVLEAKIDRWVANGGK